MMFAAPGWLLGGLLCAVLVVWSWYRHDRRQRAALSTFAAAHLISRLTASVSTARRRIRRGLFLAALLLLCAALARPLYGFRWEQVSRRGNDIVFAIDTSRSMLTPDVAPNRLMRAKLAIDDLARLFDGDAMGIVAFSGTAFLACPITLDYTAFHESLAAIDTHTIPRGGTSISSAIQEADTALRRRPGSDKILILVTDGEDLEGGALAAAQAAAKADGLKIFTIGVGTAAGELIPVPAEQGGGFVKNDAGAAVRSKLDEAGLEAIAAATGGRYVPLGGQSAPIEEVFRQALDAVAKHDLAYRQQRIYTERYQWPLGASLLLLLLGTTIGTRRRARTVAPLVLVAIFSMANLAAPVQAAERDAQAPLQDFNSGTQAYRAGQYSQAARAFQQSIRRAPSGDRARLAQQQDAYYNLGNTLYRAGQKTEKTSREETLKAWNSAVQAYDSALQLRPEDRDSQYNRDFVKRKIDELKQDPPPDPPPSSPPPPSPKGSPPAGGQPPPGQPTPGAPPPGGAPPPPTAPAPGESPPATAPEQPRAPGQMSTEEAQQLLDSAKGEERPALQAPAQQQNGAPPPDKPFKNW
jgi:Ca-activated chloride channel homolog